MASKPNKCGAEDRNNAVKSWEADRAEGKEGAAGRESKRGDPEVLVLRLCQREPATRSPGVQKTEVILWSKEIPDPVKQKPQRVSPPCP